VDGKTVNQAFGLRHGRSRKLFNLDKVSNGRLSGVLVLSLLVARYLIC